MLKDSTRKAVASAIMLSLRGGNAVETVKAAQDIFHTEWTKKDIQLLCEHVKEYEMLDWANEIWANDVDQIYKQLFLFTVKATDFQLALWLEKIWGNGEKALKFLVSCEKEIELKGGNKNDSIF